LTHPALGACQQLQVLWLLVIGLEGTISASVWQLPNFELLVIEDINVVDVVDNGPWESTSSISCCSVTLDPQVSAAPSPSASAEWATCKRWHGS
jgi:hypothetical protein